MTTMPSLFIGHGSPMNTIEDNGYTRAWRKLGRALPQPRAVLMISAHWFIGTTAITAMPHPRTIHDFYGFPDELFAFEYPAPGLPELAGEVAEVVKPYWVGADQDQWGLDHGAWSVLAHLFPLANVPIVQLSINANKPLDYHLDLAIKLNELRRRGIMIISSGNVVHNLSRIEWDLPDAGADWAHRFDDMVVRQMTEAPSDILKATEHPDYNMAAPTPDHFIPLVYTAGISAAENKRAQVLLRGYTWGSLSMTCYGIGVDGIACKDVVNAAQLPEGVPPDQTNI